MSRQLETMNEKYGALQAKLEEQDYRYATLLRNFESLRNNNINNHSYPNAAPHHSEGNLISLAEMDTELRILRDQLSDERAKREQAEKEQHQLISQF